MEEKYTELMLHKIKDTDPAFYDYIYGELLRYYVPDGPGDNDEDVDGPEVA